MARVQFRQRGHNSDGREANAAESHGRPRERAGVGPNEPPKEPAQPCQRAVRFLPRPEAARTSEPILVPKLRIGFADFPYLHCSIDQRLFTLETCCGFGYEYLLLRTAA